MCLLARSSEDSMETYEEVCVATPANKHITNCTGGHLDSVSAMLAPLGPSVQDGVAHSWTAKICAAWQKSLSAIIECGQLLMAARADLPHGDFQSMVDRELPFGPRAARMLMTVARDERLTDRKHASVLPP